jgi:hypothetical protein
MPFDYEIDFLHKDASGNTKLQRRLAGSHFMTISPAAGPLDVSLEELPIPGTSSGTFRLTLTEAATGPRSDISGTWDYEVFFSHQTPTGEINQASLATGSHFVSMNLETNQLDIVLEELVQQGQLNPRLHFTFKSK